MTINTLKYLEQEVIDFLNRLLDVVKDKSFSDYVLLLSRASYQVENENTLVSPYVIQSNLELRQDESRQRFLHSYLNQYVSSVQESVFPSVEIAEFNYNLQLMLYSHVWESHRFLMNLKRISSILSGKGYAWRIPFEHASSRKDKSKMIPINRGKFIKEQILEPLMLVDHKIYEFLSSIYDGTIRNSYSHSMYFIDMDGGKLEFLKCDTYSTEKEIDFCEWEDLFVETVLFSYHLTRLLSERLNTFVKNYPNVREVSVNIPSAHNPGLLLEKRIYPMESEYKGRKFVEFCFSGE